MALNFPDNPSLNDIYEDSTSGFSYQWNGTIWKTYVANSLSFDENDYLRSNAADTKTSGDLTFSDNVKLNIGTGNDLEIFHDGTRSYIDSKGTQLRIESDAIRLRSDGGETYFEADVNDATKLYYDNSLKLATSSSGVTVTGTLAATSASLSSASIASGHIIINNTGAKVIGVVTATSFDGDGSALTGISAGITTGKAIAVTMILG